MRNVRKSERIDVEQIIIDVLREQSKTWEELKNMVVNEDVTYSTFNRHLNKLIKQGLVRDAKYELVQEMFVEEADRKNVLEIIERLSIEPKPEILEFLINNLSSLAGSKRVAHLPEVLNFCEEAFQNPKYKKKNVLLPLINLLNNINHFERTRKPQNYGKIIERISGTSLQSILKIIATESDYNLLLKMTTFLWTTDKEDSVDGLFNLIERLDDEIYNKLKKHIFDVLFRYFPLYRAQNKYIDKKIEELLKSHNPRITKRIKELILQKTSDGYNY